MVQKPPRLPVRTAGFTLLEVLLVVSVLVVIAAVAVPMLGRKDEARVTRALSECGRIAAALARYEGDTARRPLSPPGGPEASLLTGDLGTPPTLAQAPGGIQRPLRSVLGENLRNDRRWRGPYLDAMQPDPWGAAYVVLAPAKVGEPIWILSAGPDGAVQTRPSDPSPAGDDLGVRW